MDFDYKIQFNSKNKLEHFLNIELLNAQHINEIIALAEYYDNEDIKKFNDLNGKTIASLFFEPSTRTKTTFELASKKLSADFINIDVANSSTNKGESILDMIKTLEAMDCDMFIVRHSISGTPHYIAQEVGKNIAVVNAGDGSHAHPTQAMLDVFTIKRNKGDFKNLNISIVGDLTMVNSPLGILKWLIAADTFPLKISSCIFVSSRQTTISRSPSTPNISSKSDFNLCGVAKITSNLHSQINLESAMRRALLLLGKYPR